MRQFFTLGHGVPSHDIFSRVFRLLEPAPFHTSFGRCMAAFAAGCQGAVAIDRKTARRSFNPASAASPVHLLSARGCQQHAVLARRKVMDEGNKITAIALRALLDLDAHLVSTEMLSTANAPPPRQSSSAAATTC